MGHIVSVPRDEDEVDSESVKGESTLLFFTLLCRALRGDAQLLLQCCCSPQLVYRGIPHHQ